jgi:hypothetical protein
MADTNDSNNAVRNEYLPKPTESWAQMAATPENFLHESFQTEPVEEGVRKITGEVKDQPGKRVDVAYYFSLPQFTSIKAQEWLAKHNIRPAKFDPPRDTTYRQITAKAARLPGVSFQLRADAGTLPKLDILVYTGGKVQPEGWDYPICVDLRGLEIEDADQTAVLKDHDPDLVVGHGMPINSLTSLSLKGVVSGTGPAAREVVNNSKNGFQWKSSIGCDRLVAAEFIESGKSREVNGQTIDGPCYYWPKSILREVTITGRGADPNSRVSIAAKARASSAHKRKVRAMADIDNEEKCNALLKSMGHDPDTMDQGDKEKFQTVYKALHAEAAEDGEVAKNDKDGAEGGEKEVEKKMAARMRKTFAAETQRLDTIQKCHRELCAAWSMEVKDHQDKRKAADELRAKAADLDWSTDKVELEFMRLGRPDKIVSGSRGNDVDALVLQAAACKTLGMDDAKRQKHFKAEVLEAADRRELKGLGLKSLLAISGRARGFTPPMGAWTNSDVREALACAYPSPHALRAEASTFQLPGILSNLANKYLYEGFWMISDGWSKISSKRNAPDFKPVPGFRIFANLTFEKIGANGEIPHGTVGELVYVNAAETYAKGIVTTRQDIINDDLTALSRIPQLIGMGAAYALAEKVWSVFLNGTDSQGVTVFSTGHSNYVNGSITNNGITQSTSALSTTSLAVAIQKFQEQTKPDGRPLMFQPKILLVPPALRNTARQIYKSTELRQIVTALGSTNAAATTEVQSTNIYQGEYEPVVEPYIGSALAPTGSTGSDAAWYLFAAPEQLALVELVFLNGQQTPTVESSEADFDVLGLAHRGFFDFGCKLMEYRAAVKASGA